jgi:hypothetical protein
VFFFGGFHDRLIMFSSKARSLFFFTGVAAARLFVHGMPFQVFAIFASKPESAKMICAQALFARRHFPLFFYEVER